MIKKRAVIKKREEKIHERNTRDREVLWEMIKRDRRVETGNY
jgi:hypothetical protein